MKKLLDLSQSLCYTIVVKANRSDERSCYYARSFDDGSNEKQRV